MFDKQLWPVAEFQAFKLFQEFFFPRFIKYASILLGKAGALSPIFIIGIEVGII